MGRQMLWVSLLLSLTLNAGLIYGTLREARATAGSKQVQQQYNEAMASLHQALQAIRAARLSQGDERRQAILRATWRLNEGVQKLDSLVRLYPRAETAKLQSALSRLKTALTGLQYIAIEQEPQRLDEIHALVLQVTAQFPAEVDSEAEALRALQ